MALFVVIACASGAAALFPGEVAIPLGQWVAARITAEKLIKLAVETLALLPAAFLVELIVVGWGDSSIRRLFFRPSVSGKVDLVVYVIQELRLARILGAPLAFAGFGAIKLTGNGVLADRLGISHLTAIDDPVMGFAACWLVRDFVFYWLHRAEHSRLLWPLHRLHHSATEMTVISSERTNFFADLLLDLAIVVPLSLVTVDGNSLLACQMVVTFHGLITHSNWNADWGWFGRWVLVSPRHHRLHHGLFSDQYTSNFGTMPIWDRLFGTYRDPPAEAVAIGIRHPAYDSVGGTLKMLVLEPVECARMLVGRPVSDPSAGVEDTQAPERLRAGQD